MPAPMWWLSYQRTMVPISAMPMAAQVMREPSTSMVLLR